ncbi:MAG: radical SAM protein [Chloroflexota bacterium]
MAMPKVTVGDCHLLDGSRCGLVSRVGDGSIITRFDKTPIPENPTDVVCPHFLELKWATGCPYDCAWCYLKGTLRFQPQKTKPQVKSYGKVEQHVRSFLGSANGHRELLNTGELADSLMWERKGPPFSTFILSLFEGQEQHKVLFVTKSTNVEHLLEGAYQDTAVVSFSLNAEAVAERFEKGAPSVAERIEAGRKLAEARYEVRVRIDPMVPVEGWQDAYRGLVGLIFSAFTPSRITLGSLRGLQSTINNASDKDWVKYLCERSNWGRKVAFDTRYAMYRDVTDYLRARYGYAELALCKETVAIWNKVGMDYRQIRCNCVP